MKFLSTDDTALATYLYLNNVDFIKGTVRTEVKKRRAFIFKEQAGIYKMIDDFYNNRVVVKPLDYQQARSQISKWLKTDITNIKIKTKKE